MSIAQKPTSPPKEKSPQTSTEKAAQTPAPALAARITSLDQFRGYTVAGMFLVNFLSSSDAWVPRVLLHHHNYCSYADTIMPQFLFAVGFAFRLTFGRRAAAQGLRTAYLHMIKRLIGIMLVAFAIYEAPRAAQTWDQLVDIGFWGAIKEPLKRQWMQTLGHIVVTSLWLLPVIRAGALVRIVYMLFSAAAHVALSNWFVYIWTNTSPNGVDGGPFAFLTWSVPAILGTLTCDAIAGIGTRSRGWTLTKLTLWSFLIMIVGYGISCGTRMYDLTPEDSEAIQAAQKAQAEAGDELNSALAPLAKQRSEGAVAIRKVEAEIQELRRKELSAVVEELKTPETNPLFFRFLVDKAERAYESREKTPEMQAAIEKLEKAKTDANLAGLKQKMDEIKAQKVAEFKERGVRMMGDKFVDLKLAPDPVIPTTQRFNAWKERVQQDWKRNALATAPFVMPPQDDPRIDSPPLKDHFLWNYWMITQRGGSLSYTTFCAGFSLLVYVLFYIACDMWGWQVGLFRTFGTNALAGYVLHSIIAGAVKQFLPSAAPWWYGVGAFLFYFWLVYLFVRTLEKNRIYLKL